MPCHGLAWVFWTREGPLTSWSWGSSQSSLQSGSTHRHALHRIWWRVSSFGPRRLLQHWDEGSSWSVLFFHRGSPLQLGEWRQWRCLPQEDVVGSNKGTFQLWWAVVQDNLTGREEVGLTSALLSSGLFLQVPHDVAMFLSEWCSLRDPLGLDLTDGLGTSSFGLLDQMASGCLGFLDCH